MNQIHIISGKDRFDFDKLKQSTNSIIRATVIDGKWGLHPPGQWSILHLGAGQYRIKHNLGTVQYGVCVSPLGKEYFSIETSNLMSTEFDVQIKKDSKLTDTSFAISLNFHTG